MKKLVNILQKVFSLGILACLFAGALSVLGYVTAMVIGGEMAPVICAFVLKSYFPIVIRVTSVFVAVGLLTMYLGKNKALAVESDKAEK